LGKKLRVSVYIDEGVVEEIDKLCEILGCSRSKCGEMIFRNALRRCG